MFVRAYTLINDDKHVAVFQVDTDGTRLMCNTGTKSGSAGPNGPKWQSKDIAETLLDRMRQIAKNHQSGNERSRETLNQRSVSFAPVRWSAALLRGLCYVNKHCNCSRGGGGQYGHGDADPRMLCIVASPDDSSEYLAMMNGIFAAQRRGIVVDACVLNSSHSSFMQQACFLTKGNYLHPRNPQALIQYLMVSFCTI